MKDWWDQLTQRERLLVQYGSAALLLFILLWFGLRPGLARISKLQQQLAANQTLLSWMAPQADKIVSLRAQQSGTQKLTVSRLLPALQDELQATELAQGLLQISLAADNRVSLSFDKVSFDAFISWYSEISKRYGVVAETLSVSSLDTDGMVKIEARLRTASS